MIDIRKLKELVRLMVENDLTELDLNDQQETVSIKRGGDTPPIVHHAPVQQAAAPAVAPAAAAPTAEAQAEAGGGDAGASGGDEGLVAIESPMVGTFYTSPNPDSPAFVEVGKSVSADTTVCLVEAMKVFNEIKAECSGTIERVLVKSGDAVEYGQKLFMVKPS